MRFLSDGKDKKRKFFGRVSLFFEKEISKNKCKNLINQKSKTSDINYFEKIVFPIEIKRE